MKKLSATLSVAMALVAILTGAAPRKDDIELAYMIRVQYVDSISDWNYDGTIIGDVITW